MNKYNIFFKGTFTKGIINSPGRGESGWITSIARIIDNLGCNLFIYPYSSNPWGPNKSSEEPESFSDRATLIPVQKPTIYNDIVKKKFDIAMFLIDGKADTLRKEIRADNPNRIKANLYIYGNIWEGGMTKGIPYDNNDIVVRQFKWHLDMNQKEHTHFLLARPLGKIMGKSKFSKRRIGWAPKYVFINDYNSSWIPSTASRFLNAMVDAANETNTGITVFSSDLFDDPNALDNIKKFKVIETLSKAKDIKFIPTCSPNDFNEELKNCSIVFPMGKGISGSVLEAIFFGITPIIFKDSLLMKYPGIINIASEMTEDRLTRDYKESDIKNKMIKLLTNEEYYNSFLNKLQPFFKDNLDSEVIKQFESIVSYGKKKGFLQ